MNDFLKFFDRIVKKQQHVFHLPVPDEVAENYMAPHGDFPDRLKKHTPKKIPAKPEQLSLEL